MFDAHLETARQLQPKLKSCSPRFTADTPRTVLPAVGYILATPSAFVRDDLRPDIWTQHADAGRRKILVLAATLETTAREIFRQTGTLPPSGGCRHWGELQCLEQATFLAHRIAYLKPASTRPSAAASLAAESLEMLLALAPLYPQTGMDEGRQTYFERNIKSGLKSLQWALNGLR